MPEWAAGRPLLSNGCWTCQCGEGNWIGNTLTFFFGGICPEDLTRFRLLITSVLRLIGLGRPCSFRNKPQALQRTEPASSLRHNGVVDV
jgi:hypothetical protein